jgi:hypothetical protein
MWMTKGRPDRRDRISFGSYLALSLYFTWPLLASGARLGISDWDPILFQHASVIRSAYEYGSLPFWNPWFCGGDVLWQNPQAPLLTPVHLFALAMPLASAMKLNILVHYLAGFAGMHLLLTRSFRLAYAPAAVFLAATFTLAGGAAFHLIVGHGTFLPYFYLPWLLFFLLCALETGELRFAVAAAAAIALGIYAGGTHVVFMGAVGLGFLALAVAVLRRDWRPLALIAASGVLAALFAAPKLMPLLRFLGTPGLVDIRYFLPEPDRVTPEMLTHLFTDAHQYPRLRFPGQLYGWHEYANYLGALGSLLIAASVVWILIDRRARRANATGVALAITSLILFALMLGEFGGYAPYILLHRLPLMSQFRLPSRFTLVLTLFGVATAAAALRGLALDRAGDRRLSRFAGVVLVLATFDVAYWNRVHFAGSFTLAPLRSSFRLLSRPAAPAIDAQTDAFAGDSPMLRAMMERNQAVLKCNEPLQLPGEVQPGKPIVFAEGGARISEIQFRPNRIRFAVLAREGDRVFMNQRYANGWRSSAGALEIDPASKLGFVRVPPGTAARVELSFSPPGLVSGLILLLIGLLTSAALWRRTLAPAPVSTAPAPGALQS